MSNPIANTHRRSMRAVTPITRVGRSTAGAAIAAGIAVTGAQAAVAVENTDNANAHAVAPAAVEPASVAIPIVKADTADAESVFGAVAAPESIALTPQAPVAPQPERTQGQAAQSEGRQSERSQRTERSQNTRGTSQRDQNSQGQSSSTKSASQRNSEKKSSSAPAQRGGNVMGTARSGIGTRYVYGGSTPAGWDCSGFVSWVFAQHGVSLPHSASAIVNSSKVQRISASQARPGDLVFYPGHIGIYAGNGRTIDAGTRAGSTQERGMWSANWSYYRVVG